MRFPALKLKNKLQLSFLLIGFISVLITGWLAYITGRSALEELTFQRLTAVREAKRHEIEHYFQQVRSAIIRSSSDPAIVALTRDLRRAFRPMLDDPGLRRDIRAAAAAGALPASGIAERYLRTVAHADRVMRPFVAEHGYYDVFLVDAASGDVLYTVEREDDFASNLRSGPHQGSNIAEVFRAAAQAGNPDFTRFVDFQRYAPSRDAPACFVASPVCDDGACVGVLIFQLSIDEINRVMTDAWMNREDGSGESGETYIVGTDNLMRNDSRFFIEHPEDFLRLMKNMGEDDFVVEAMHRYRTSVLLLQVRTEAADAALSGITDTRIVTDYRGETVLSSFTPLDLPDLRWVLLSEIDESEAFRSVYELREQLLLSGFIILLFAVSLGFVISQPIARPIRSLTLASEQFGKGEFDRRAAVRSRDEIGQLAETFNTMADKITFHTGRLEAEISERRRAEEQLKTSQEQFRNLSRHLQGVREEERKSVAREIHDELGQRLTTLKLQLALLQEDLPGGGDALQPRFRSLLDEIDTTIQTVKRIISQLRPGLLDDLGLTAAIEWQAEEFQERTGITCAVSIQPQDIVLDQDRSTAVFRVFQETLTNVARHAGASRVDVRLTRGSGRVTLSVEDNGCGISAEAASSPVSFGLIGMSERAHYFGGSVVISARRGGGTHVTLSIPTASTDEAA